MPYAKRKRGDKWVILNAETLDVKGTHDSEIKADRQLNLLNAVEHGWHPTGAKARK